MHRRLGLLAVAVLVGASDSCSNSTAPAIVADFYVDAVHGDDANAGTSAAPFKTITKALSVAADGNTIKVRPGRYDEANGESFPLVGPTGVILIGDEANKGGGSTPTKVVSRTSSPLFAPPANAVIAGFTITDSLSTSGVTATVRAIYDSVTLRDNRLTNSTGVGGVNAFGRGDVITQNVFADNKFGLVVAAGKIEDNVFTHNFTGVVVQTSNADLGGGVGGSAGGNVLSCNAAFDLEPLSGLTITATGNQWDHVPPTTDTTKNFFTAGIDIYNEGGSSTVLTSGATVAPGACP